MLKKAYTKTKIISKSIGEADLSVCVSNWNETLILFTSILRWQKTPLFVHIGHAPPALKMRMRAQEEDKSVLTGTSLSRVAPYSFLQLCGRELKTAAGEKVTKWDIYESAHYQIG